MKKTYFLFLIAASLNAGLAGCSDDDTTTTGAEADTGTGTDTDVDSSVSELGDGDLGDFCWELEDCKSGYCESYRGVPPDPNGFCDDALPVGQIRILGNLRNFETLETIPNTELRFVGGLQAATAPEVTYDAATMKVTTDADANFGFNAGDEATSQAIGVVAMMKEDGYYLTGTGLIEPELGGGIYPPGVRNHDVMAFEQSFIDKLSALIAADDNIKDLGPLGDRGGVIGRIRYVESGDAVEGATLTSLKENNTSTATVLYPNENFDEFKTDSTGTNGIFVVLKPGLAEKFEARRGDKVISDLTVTVGSAPDIIFAVSMHVKKSVDQ